MGQQKTSATLAGCAVIILLVIFSQFNPQNSSGRNIESGDMLAAVGSAKKPASLNAFTRQKEPYLSLTSPFFDFISAFTAKPQHTTASTPDTIGKNDVLTITSPKNLTPVTDIKSSIVNIFCSQKIGNLRRIVTGSGVIIKENLVLSDAHVAAFPLVADSHSEVTCLARTGSPAQSTHSIRTVFISPEWVQQHGQNIASSYTETGEDDFALLKIEPLSSSYKKTLPPLSIKETVPEIGSTIQAAAYPANTLQANGTQSALRSQIEQLTIRNLLTFNGRRSGPSDTDLIQTSPSIVGQQGSSGGVILDQNNYILGLISTVLNDPSSTEGNNGDKKLIHSLTIAGINKSLEKYTTGGLSHILLFGSDELANDFNIKYRSALTSTLSQALSL